MKRVFLLMVIAVMAVGQSHAQMTFKRLLEDLDWNMTEAQLLQAYPDKLQKNENDLYCFTDIDLQGLAVNVIVVTNSETKQLLSLGVIFPEGYLSKGKEFYYKDAYNKVSALFGPAHMINDPSAQVPNYVRMWTLDNFMAVLGDAPDEFGKSTFVLGLVKTDNDKPHFRKSKWGDLMGQVIAIEGKEDFTPNFPNLYSFKTRIAGLSCYAAFDFVDNKLVSGRYKFMEQYANDQQHIKDYEKLVNLLTSKYGEPDSEDKHYRDDTPSYLKGKSMVSSALTSGYLTYNTRWSALETYILCALYSVDDEIYMSIMYSGTKYAEMAQEEELEGCSGLYWRK